MVSLQFSKKFYYSGCLTSSLNPVKNKGIVQKYTISISNGNIQKKCVNPLDFNFPRIRNLLENPHSHQLEIENSQKKEKNNTSQMRLRSVFKMFIRILNTAITEQMGCIIFFFFRLLLNLQIRILVIYMSDLEISKILYLENPSGLST